MRSSVLFYLILLCSIGSWSAFADGKKVKVAAPVVETDDERSLEDVVNDYTSLQKSIDQMLRTKIADCKPDASDPSKTYCSVKDICASKDINIDGPILYQNAKGEKILNQNYYKDRQKITACIKEAHADEIKDKRDELNTKLGNAHLKTLITVNRKLADLTTRYNQGAQIQKVSTEILNMSLEAGLKGEPNKWEQKLATRADLSTLLSQAEKRTKTTLNPEIKKYLVEIQFQKMNPAYEEEVKRFEENLIPETVNQDPFYNWNLLTDEKAAGGKKQLEANRALLTQKAQEAYGLFKETQQELIAYFESKKNETNIDKINRIEERIRTVSFTPPRLTPGLKESCGFPNATYDQDTHSFVICPEMLNFPKITILETMAHEMSHSYDSCSFSEKLFHKKGPVVVEDAPFDVNLKMDPIAGNYIISKDIDNDEPTKDRTQDRMLYKDNPFSNTLSCLQDPKSVHAQAVDPEKIKKAAQESLAEMTRLGQNTPKNPRARQLNFLNDHLDYFDYYQGCNKESADLVHTQLEEAFADKIASEVIARKFKTMSKAEADQSIIEIGLTYDICTTQGEAALKLKDFGVKEGCSVYFENKDTEDKVLAGVEAATGKFDTHPDNEVRVEKNILAHPAIRSALKCPVDPGVKYCE